MKGCKICGISDLDTLNFVAVLVKPDEEILEKIKHLPFDYYQIYDCTPEEIKKIKEKYNKRIITALTVIDESDVQKYHLFSEVTDIYLFDSKGYEKSMSFNHELIKKIKDLVVYQAKLAAKANLDALVCSPQEVKIVKKVFRKEIITPGIRFSTEVNDQKPYFFRSLYYQINKYQLPQKIIDIFQHPFYL